ncbi:MAG: hypothetical protein ACJ789_07655 [Thermomicrobiales bacterium]
MDHSQPVADRSQGVNLSPARPRYHLDYAKWYAALSGHNDGCGTGASPSFDLRDLFLAEAEAA